MSEFGAADRSSSNMAGVTLMNNQVGYVVADVMRGKDGVTVTDLPSMIRVDGVNKVDFDYEELAEALGWDDFGNDDAWKVGVTVDYQITDNFYAKASVQYLDGDDIDDQTQGYFRLQRAF